MMRDQSAESKEDDEMRNVQRTTLHHAAWAVWLTVQARLRRLKCRAGATDVPTFHADFLSPSSFFFLSAPKLPFLNALQEDTFFSVEGSHLVFVRHAPTHIRVLALVVPRAPCSFPVAGILRKPRVSSFLGLLLVWVPSLRTAIRVPQQPSRVVLRPVIFQAAKQSVYVRRIVGGCPISIDLVPLHKVLRQVAVKRNREDHRTLPAPWR
mmetsp:Transcript_45947/g.127522  ORF Transcript_45947/g.127522 Transcript_45947/m.127522 type:complete len:209 (+) Transcript_45947:68-694(+)